MAKIQRRQGMRNILFRSVAELEDSPALFQPEQLRGIHFRHAVDLGFREALAVEVLVKREQSVGM